MSAYFLDSSALVKRYVAETGTLWVQALVAPSTRHKLLITRITWVEVLSALARRQRDGSLSSAQVDGSVRSFRYDLGTQYQVIEFSRELAETAGQLVRKHPLRAYDAVQLASALRVQLDLVQAQAPPLTFICADDHLLAVAQAEGLRTDNPNQHL